MKSRKKSIIYYTTSKQLIVNCENFFTICYYGFIEMVLRKKGIFVGWGRKNSGLKAVKLAEKKQTSYRLLEDGFIRSIGLGVDGYPSFSLVIDDIGIYYDAKNVSALENLLNSYDFKSDKQLMIQAQKAINLIRKYEISKYNNASNIGDDFFKKLDRQRVLIITQTAGDASLKYGMLKNFSTDEIIDAAIKENPNADVYLKIHPDVLSGKKEADFDVDGAKQKCFVLDDNVNPISLLKYFDKVYTKTSGMGFEALLVGCKCVCFGMPFYAGWGVTQDRVACSRRKRKLSIEEIFAAAYILYTRYYNVYTQKESDIFDIIDTIVRYRKIEDHK